MAHGLRHRRSYGHANSTAAHRSVTSVKHSAFDAPAEGEFSTRYARTFRGGYFISLFTLDGRTFSGCGDTEEEARGSAAAVAEELTGRKVGPRDLEVAVEAQSEAA